MGKKKHGLAGKKNKNLYLYKIYCTMMDRCFNPECKEYKNYGGRGVTVCARWQGEHGASRFVSDILSSIGPRLVADHSLDRIDNEGDYQLLHSIKGIPQLRWATEEEQQANRRAWGKSKYRGVAKHSSDRWRARVTVNGKRISVGIFTSEIEAALARDKAVLQLNTGGLLNFLLVELPLAA